jgi:hypothetical protein
VVVVEEGGGGIRRGVEEGSRLLLLLLLAGFHLYAAAGVGRPAALHRGGAVLLLDDVVLMGCSRLGMGEAASRASLLWPGGQWNRININQYIIIK